MIKPPKLLSNVLSNAHGQGKIDIAFLSLVLIISLFGTITVFTAGYAYALTRYGDAAYFMKRQLIWLFLGIGAMFFSSRLQPRKLKDMSVLFYTITLVLLLLTLVVGFVGNGAKRWISIGPITIQPSEIAKLTMVMMLARYYSVMKDKATSKKGKFIFGTFIPFIIILIPIILVMLQNKVKI